MQLQQVHIPTFSFSQSVLQSEVSLGQSFILFLKEYWAWIVAMIVLVVFTIWIMNVNARKKEKDNLQK
jgi:hypothetical protein